MLGFGAGDGLGVGVGSVPDFGLVFGGFNVTHSNGPAGQSASAPACTGNARTSPMNNSFC